MTSTQLPPLSFDDGGFRVVLMPDLDNSMATASASGSSHRLDVFPQTDTGFYAELDGGYDDDDMFPAHLPSDLAPQPNIPIHPISLLQDAFSESLQEVTTGAATGKPKLADMDAKIRREKLLAQDKDDEPFDASWRLRTGQQQHEVVKLVSQISFGVYLLLNGMANSNVQVVNILQGHIDEIDEFLEVVLEDLAETTTDLTKRIDYLKQPMSNLKTFEQLLEDRDYRAEILEGNEKIEHVLARTNMAMKQWDEDIDAGLQSSTLFVRWLEAHKDGDWRMDQPDLLEIFDAMKGNAEGWLIAFEQMSDQAQDINELIIRLMTTVAEMEKKAGEVSRRTWANIAPFSLPPRTSVNVTALSSPPPSSSHRSPQRSATRSSARSGSISVIRSITPVHEYDEDEDDTATLDFPLPGGLPLLPPTKSSSRPAPGRISYTSRPSRAESAPKPPSVRTAEPDNDGANRDSTASDVPLLLLQPRTYTPQLPEPLPSPRVKENTKSPAPEREPREIPQSKPRAPLAPKASAKTKANALSREDSDSSKRTSLRDRVSLKTSPPDAIQIPPRSIRGMELTAPSPNHGTPRTIGSQPRDSAYGSDVEHYGLPPRPRAGSNNEMSPPIYPNAMPSPRSDHRSYRPVHASPHSPLQQRPHTAAGQVGQRQHQHQQQQPSYPPPRHLRNKPSQLGSMSMLSNVTTATYDDRTASPSVRTATPGGGKQVKKKKSAFGWFKKAFSMDEEERLAFEARKAMQNQDHYYDSNTPKFLDGRRVK